MKTTETLEHNRYTKGDLMADIAMAIWVGNVIWLLLWITDGAQL